MGNPKHLMKLVRDKVETNIDSSQVFYEPIENDDKYIEQLRFKLHEEAMAYIFNPGPEELADVLEVVCALIKHDHAVRGADLTEVRLKTRSLKGGFDSRIGMFVQLRDVPDA